jgi:hypothetical protein
VTALSIIIALIGILNAAAWGFGTLYVGFVKARRLTRSKTMALAVSFNMLCKTQPRLEQVDSLEKEFIQWLGSDDVRIAASDEINALMRSEPDKGGPWRYFYLARQFANTGAVTPPNEANGIADDIKRQLNNIVNKRLTLGLKAWWEWLGLKDKTTKPRKESVQ